MTGKEKEGEYPESEITQYFRLEQNHPNPFDKKTNIRFLVPHVSPVRLAIINRDNNQVRLLFEGEAQPGWHDLQWDGMTDEGLPAPTGNYQYRLETPRYVATRKLEIKR